MTPRARRIVERRQQRSAAISERNWQELLKADAESRRLALKPIPLAESDDYEARTRRALRPR